jgi:hypothetical protein
MDKDVAAAINELKRARVQIQAMTTVLCAQIAVHHCLGEFQALCPLRRGDP